MAVKYHCRKCGKRFIDWGAEKLDFKCPECEEEELVRVGSAEDKAVKRPSLKRKVRRAPPPPPAEEEEFGGEETEPTEDEDVLEEDQEAEEVEEAGEGEEAGEEAEEEEEAEFEDIDHSRSEDVDAVSSESEDEW